MQILNYYYKEADQTPVIVGTHTISVPAAWCVWRDQLCSYPDKTAFLDIPTRFEICRLLAELAHNQGKTIIFSTHDIDAALSVCDSVAIMDSGSISVYSADNAAGVLKELFSL